MNRRELVRAGALAVVGASATAGAVVRDRRRGMSRSATGPGTARTLDVVQRLEPRSDEDVLVRMQRELVRAMAKPVEERKWLMVIDTRKCVGCHACTIGCVAENKLPPGVVYRPVVIEEVGHFPNVRLEFTPRPCMQCDSPPCTDVCPVGATWKGPDGAVVIDYDRCIGCRYCLTACPYGARTSDFGEQYTDRAEGAAKAAGHPLLAEGASLPEQAEGHEYGKRWRRKGHDSPIGNARKCHFCLHRLEVGQLPMCVTTCIGRATAFGDANDTSALVNVWLGQHRTVTLLPHMHTKPRVHYIL